jgi:hypothetical protein
MGGSADDTKAWLDEEGFQGLFKRCANEIRVHEYIFVVFVVSFLIALGFLSVSSRPTSDSLLGKSEEFIKRHFANLQEWAEKLCGLLATAARPHLQSSK